MRSNRLTNYFQQNSEGGLYFWRHIMGAENSPEERAANVERAFNSALATVRTRASEFQRLAERQRGRFNRARAATVILGVITPTFVTYQTQHNGGPEVAIVLGILAILFTASAGIVAGLQTTFRWGEGFGRASSASLELEELADNQELGTLVVRSSNDPMTKHAELVKHLDETVRQMRLVVRKFNEGELALVKEAEHSKSAGTTAVQVPAGHQPAS
jgi:Protein of unknown function (DUF4231)